MAIKNIFKRNKEEIITQEVLDEIIPILEQATLKLFPAEGRWSCVCFERPSDLYKQYLPCHLRDSKWLAQMLKLTDERLNGISMSVIENYVNTSAFFQEKRHEYEQRILSWQIDWMLQGGENWLVSEEYGGDFIMFSEDYDIGFRKGIVDTLRAIGINEEAIEEGIEGYAQVWRNKCMRRAFINRYCHIPSGIPFFFHSIDSESIDEEHFEKWLKLRKYEYYQRHQASVDKYGIVEEDMLMSEIDAQQLRKELEQMHDRRMSQINTERNEETQARANAMESFLSAQLGVMMKDDK